MSKYKLLVTASTFPRFIGDTEPRFIYDLSCELKKYFDVTVLVPADPIAELTEDMNGLKVVRYRYAPLRAMETLAYPGAIVPRLKENPLRYGLVPFLGIGLYKNIKKLINEIDFDCVHAHWLIPQGVIQSMFTSKNHPPFIVTGHGGDVMSLNNIMFNSMKRNVLLKASAVTAVSKPLKKRMLELCKDESMDIRTIPMGCNLEKFSPNLRNEHYFKQYGLTRPVVLFVGRLAEKKGLTYLINALAKPELLKTSVSLAIVGYGPLQDELKQETKRLGLESRIYFLGAKTHEELPEIYASADIFCAPSIIAKDGDTEGLPTVMIEAGASGLPIVSTRVSGIPEIVVNETTGILVEQKDTDSLAKALERLVLSKDLRKKMGEAGRIYVRKFEWERIGEEYSRLLINVIEKCKKKGD